MDSLTPPQNLEAEASVLGSILLDNEVFSFIEGILSDGQFYKEGHRKIYRACQDLLSRGDPIDLVTINEILRQRGELDAVGGPMYLLGLVENVPTAAYAEHYARIVAEKAVLRDLISTNQQIMKLAFEQSLPIEQILDKAEASVFELSSHKRTHGFTGMRNLVNETFQHITNLNNNPDPISGLRTGFRDLDSITAGLQPSSLNVLAARPSMGKCLGRGTRVVMADGSLSTVETLQVGDALLGPDSRPRQIRSLARGREAMYWVRQRHGVDYRVNESHVLSLKCSRAPGRGETTTISVKAWLERSAKFQNNWKGYKVAIELPSLPVPVEPYFLGLWLGDGATDSVRVTTSDSEVVDYLYGYAERLGMHVSIDQCGGRCPSYAVTRGVTGGSSADKAHSLQGRLATLGVLGDKHIPDLFLRNGKQERLELLAGLIDADGHYLRSQNSPYEITTTSERLATQIKYLCDTLGYRTSLKTKLATLKRPDRDLYQTTVYRVRFNGNVDEIPVRIPRKQARTWTDRRDWQVTGISIEPDGVGDYYGFTLDGDGLFLLEDMTVTHNTALALTIGQHVALRENKTVGIFSLEMSAMQLVMRMLCSEARVDMSRVNNSQLSERDFVRLTDVAGRMSEANIYIDDAADLTVMELRSRARRLMAEHGLGLVIIDYLQLMHGSGGGGGGGENRQQEISVISRGLKALARELDVPVLVLSQLSRAVESRPNKRPMLSDLRECVTGDTLVVLSDGRRVPIRDLVGTQPCVSATTDDGRLVPARSDKVWSVGTKPVLELELASGRTLRATAKHRLLTARGWQRLGDLNADDYVAVAREPFTPSRHILADNSLMDSSLVGSSAFQNRFLDAVGSHTANEARLLEARLLADPVLANPVLADPSLATRENSDLFWDRITSIVPAGKEEVFDLTVPGPASWLADGIVSHNSGAIEQDADLVMFIYRDEYYDQESEKQGIAEVIIGKQRNGPTGQVDLQFHSAHVRFNDLDTSYP
ncbi:MAG: replicative DNA helicase [Trueperaceae bacterium]|nr:replicative DNA helicase [Trueperaceae bacterium]